MTAMPDVERARFNMVEQQIRTWEVLDQTVLDLLYEVHREDFVPEAYRSLAFSDLEIPLGKEASQRMWAPRVEARVLQTLAIKKSDRILEIGTGSGYLAALLARRGHAVFSVDIDPALVESAKRQLDHAQINNVRVESGDLSVLTQGAMTYDVIVVTASTPSVPEAWLERLSSNGRLFVIVGDEPVMAARLITRTGSKSFHTEDIFETCFPALVNAPQPARFAF